MYRDFTHVGGAKTPDAKTMGRWGVALGPEVLRQVHEGVVRIARDKGVAVGRRMRVDTTVVETNIHHPTDSTLLGDGVRVLTRMMRKIANIGESRFGVSAGEQRWSPAKALTDWTPPQTRERRGFSCEAFGRTHETAHHSALTSVRLGRADLLKQMP